jgi:hypothetical protein
MMPREEDTSNNKQDRIEASEEASAWLHKRLPDQTWPLSARTRMHINMPLSVSYIRQQFRHIGESTSRLMRWVMGHSSLPLTTTRAAGLPLLSGVFDYIRRKASFVSPMVQRATDLPWFPRHPRERKHFTQTTLDLADGKLNGSLQPNNVYPDKTFQTLSDAEEGQPDYGATETYPLISNNLLSPPMTMMGLSNTKSLQTEMKPDRHYLEESTESSYYTVRKQPVHTADEASLEVTENVSLSRDVIKRAPDTKPERLPHTPASSLSAPPDTDQTVDDLQVEHRVELIHPDVSPSYQIGRPDYRQTKAVEDRPGKVNWQPPYTDQSQSLPRFLGPMSQRMPFQHSPMETHPQVTDEVLSEVQAFRPIASSKQAVTLKPKGSLHTPSAGSGALTSGDALKITSPPIIPRKSEYLSGLASRTMLPEAWLSYSEGSEVPHSEVSPGLVSPSRQARRQKPSVNSSVQLAGHKADAVYQTEGMTDRNQSSGTLNLVTPEHPGINQGFPRGSINRTLLSRESASFAGSPVAPLAVPIINRHTTILPSQQLFKSEAPASLSDRTEEHGFLYHQEHVTSSPGQKYARKPAPELPVVSSIKQDAKFSGEPGEELLKNMNTTISKSDFTGYSNVPELALTPVGAASVTAFSPVARAEESGTGGIKQEGESVNAPDIDVIASDVYGILKRRLMAERERALGVY